MLLLVMQNFSLGLVALVVDMTFGQKKYHHENHRALCITRIKSSTASPPLLLLGITKQNLQSLAQSPEIATQLNTRMYSGVVPSANQPILLCLSNQLSTVE